MRDAEAVQAQLKEEKDRVMATANVARRVYAWAEHKSLPQLLFSVRAVPVPCPHTLRFTLYAPHFTHTHTHTAEVTLWNTHNTFEITPTSTHARTLSSCCCCPPPVRLSSVSACQAGACNKISQQMHALSLSISLSLNLNLSLAASLWLSL
jgi:hypothetical protein